MAAKKDAGAIARKRKFVQQRAKELEAQGKTVDRAKLRRKWETGMVERDEFYLPGERARLRGGKKKAAPGKKQGPPVDRMPEKKAPKQGMPADRMPQGGPQRMKPADRYPGRRPGTSVTSNMETPKPGGPRATKPKQGPSGLGIGQPGKSKPKQGPSGYQLPSAGKPITKPATPGKKGKPITKPAKPKDWNDKLVDRLNRYR